MRRGSVITLGAGSVAGAVAAGALVRHRLRTGGPARPEPVTGSFANGMGYARLGTGPKTLLWLGGPFLGAPGGPLLALMAFMVRPFAAAGYSVWIVSRRPNMAMGYPVPGSTRTFWPSATRARRRPSGVIFPGLSAVAWECRIRRAGGTADRSLPWRPMRESVSEPAL